MEEGLSVRGPSKLKTRYMVAESIMVSMKKKIKSRYRSCAERSYVGGGPPPWGWWSGLRAQTHFGALTP